MFQIYSHFLSHHLKVCSFRALCSSAAMTVTDSYELLHAPAPAAILMTFKTTLVLNILDVHFARHVTYVCLGVGICLVGRDKHPDRHI